MNSSKEPVRLRQRKTPSGRISLYLDIYLGNGRREYEYLKLYLIPEKTKEDKTANRQTLILAEQVRAKRFLEVQSGKYGLDTGFKTDMSLYSYIDRLIERRYSLNSKGNWGNWRSFLVHLRTYHPKDITLGECDTKFVEGFRTYLEFKAINQHKKHYPNIPDYDKKLSQNCKHSYFNKLRCVFNTAYEEGLIPKNPVRGIKSPKEGDPERIYLTLDEVRRLAATDCRYNGLKRAYLFSCLTGLRLSDIKKMTWDEVREESGFTRIVFRQKKTKGQEYLDISKEAERYLGERGKPDEFVFADLHYDIYMRHELREWCLRAGIQKSPTFHSARHTFAVLMLDLGADIYTVQKLLGHRELRTTQIYAAILDRKKQEAVSKIPSILENISPSEPSEKG